MTEEQLLPRAERTELVTFTILVNGSALPQEIPVYSIEIQQEVNRIPTARICFPDGSPSQQEFELSSSEYFIPGNEIEISAGYFSDEETLFSGIVISQSLCVQNGRFELEVVCKDKAVKLTTTRQSRQFLEKTDADIITEILDEYELTGTIEATSLTHPEMVQYHSSDWDFIIARLESNGLFAVGQNGAIDTIRPQIAAEAFGTIRFGNNLIEFQAEIDARHQYASVSAQGWDSNEQLVATADANDPEWTTPGNFALDDLANAAQTTNYVLRHPGRISPDELQNWSDACLLRSRIAFLRGRAQIKGLAGVLPGTTLSLEGLGSRFNGLVWVSGVRHELSNGNWLTDVQIGLPNKTHTEKFGIQTPLASGLVPGTCGLHTGLVTQIEGDPENEFRIRVKVPSVSLDEEGVWARLATLDAGADRGFFFLPEVDDEVLVGFLNDDPRHPVVLGMLHSSAKAAPLEATADNPEKGYVSKSGMKVLFNDETVGLSLETPAGNKLFLDEENGEISLEDQNGNSMLFSSSGITLNSSGDLELKASGNLVVESGMNLETKAGIQWKAEGSGGVEINSSAITVIKGSLVQIN